MLVKTVFPLLVLLIIPITASALEANPSKIDLTKTNPAELVITGEIEEYLGPKRLVLTILAPDNSQTEYDVRVLEKGTFSKSITITEDWIYGNYIVYAKYGDKDLGTANFIIEEPYDPRKDVKIENSEEEKADKKPIPAPFVDPERVPQYYIDRYLNEPKYKEWFDKNFPEYDSIYEAVGLEKPEQQNSTNEVSSYDNFKRTKQLEKHGIDIYTTKANYAKGEPIEFKIRIDPERFKQSKLVNLQVWDSKHTTHSFNVQPNKTAVYKYWPDEEFRGEVKTYATVENRFHDEYFFFIDTPNPTVKDFRSDRTSSPGYYDQESNPEGLIPYAPGANLELLLLMEPIKNSLPKLIEQANKFYLEENAESAIFFFNRILEIDPDNVEIQTKKGFSLLEMEKINQAKATFENALKIEPNNVNAKFGLADANYLSGDFEDAKVLYEQALEQKPNDAYGLSFLGMTLSAMNNDKGLEHISKSLKIEPNNTDLIYNKAVALSNLKQYEEAIQTLNDVLKENPNDVDALEFKNEILKESGILKDQRLSSSFPEKVVSRCDLVYLINKEGEIHGGFGLTPPESMVEEIESITTEYQQRVSDEPWNSEEIGRELLGKIKEKMISSLMKKYTIDSRLEPILVQIITPAGTYDSDRLRDLFLMKPEHYTEDIECGKMLKTHYYDKMHELNKYAYGEDAAEKMSIAIDEALAEADKKRESNPITSINDNNGGGCLIATATYGSELAPQVQQLREIRDSKLLQTEVGTNFMNTFNDFYYVFSPYIADYERENPVFKQAVKLGITPIIATLSLMDYAETEYDVLWIGISLIMLNIGMYVGIPAFAIISMWKRF